MDDDKNIPDLLKQAGKELPFRVPDGYFDSFYQRLRPRLHQEEKATWINKVYTLIRPQLALAAVIIGLVALSYTALRIFLNDSSIQLTTEDISYVVDNYIYDLEDDLLISTITQEEIDIGWLNGGNGTHEIVDYLMEEEMDYTNLFNEYNNY